MSGCNPSSHNVAEAVTAARRSTRAITIGDLKIGGDAPISVQTMTKTDTRDTVATLRQIRRLEACGADLVRLAIPNMAAADALRVYCARCRIPLVADIHFDHKLAMAALAAGVHGLRINPGNIGSDIKVRELARAARDRGTPIRIGVNSGSLEKHILARHGAPTAAALVESALHHVRLLEAANFDAIKISVKASDTIRTIKAYRLLSRQTDYPLHLGVTEAGTRLSGAVQSSVALGILLAEGIGDTIRVSLTAAPWHEVKVGLDILRSLGLRAPAPRVISCPTCARTSVNVQAMAQRIETVVNRRYGGRHAQSMQTAPLIAVMGCMVNGPGEAREADIAIAGGAGKVALYIRGQYCKTLPETDAVAAVLDALSDFADNNTQ